MLIGTFFPVHTFILLQNDFKDTVNTIIRQVAYIRCGLYKITKIAIFLRISLYYPSLKLCNS